MDTRQRCDGNRVSRLRRAILVAGGGLLLGLLCVAAVLVPDSRGYGTHVQLGLRPCSIRLAYGVRCPSCGMTTAWAYAVRGELISAMHASVSGSVLALLAAIVGPLALVSGLRGRWTVIRPNSKAANGTILGLTILIAVEWLVRIQFS